MPVVYHVRYIGPTKARRLLLQRSTDHLLWDGTGWVEEVGRALLFCTLRDAQAEAAKLQARQIGTLPRREFECRLAVTVYGDGGRVTARDVAAYLTKLMVIGIDYEGVEIDSPLAADAFVNCRAELSTLKEAKPRPRRKPPRTGRPEVS